MKKTITRRQVLKAIANEPLEAGSFIEFNVDHKRYKTCNVCAVGAVLRSTLKHVDNPDTLYEIANKVTCEYIFNEYGVSENYINLINSIIQNKSYLQALSVQFEYLSYKHKYLKVVRRKLANWVKASFPVSFVIKY